MSEVWTDYFKKVRESCLKGTEHTPRAPLENLLNAIKPNKRITIIHEPKRLQGFGAPDFRIESGGAIIGYIETKPIEENLDKVLKSKQLKKYLPVTHNLILTNYAEFLLIKNQAVVDRGNLFYLTDLETKSAKLRHENIQRITDLFRKFFFSEPLKIGEAKALAIHLAERGRIVKEFIFEILKESSGDPFSQKVAGLYQVFKDTLVNDLSEEEFADAYAQTVLYGFFLAFLQSNKRITVDDASRLIPKSFKVIKEFFNVINDADIPAHVNWIFQEIVSLINNVDLTGIYESISFKKRHAVKDRDPYLYFYETFLGEFDPKKKKAKGVYYTPIQVVSFISQAVDSLLKSEFKKERGFADPSVTVLDFATGTGTFLVAIFELIFDSMGSDRGRFNKLVQEHLLKNFFGFEYLVAPYAIAHLKLSQLLKDNGYVLQDNERLQVFLTDTLDNAEHKSIPLMPYLSQEGKEATNIKTQKKILVITGNPPYNNYSRNNKKWIRDLVQIYKPTGEKKLNLDDDYIKFIRYAHWKIKQADQGIIGIITNNSFLNGLTHRKMREELIKDFDEIYILNLHGNSRIGETAPDGSPDENVFDIQQGVSINIFVAREHRSKQCKVFYYDLFGKREEKYDFLLNNDLKSVAWEELNYTEFDSEFNKTRWGKRFNENLNFFIPMCNAKQLKEYGEFWGMLEIFQFVGNGIKSERDRICIQFTLEAIKKVVQDFSSLSESEINRLYLAYDSRDWKVKNAKEDIIQYKNKDFYFKLLYRPFDERWTFYSGKSRGFIGTPGHKTMKHIFNKQNIGLMFLRNISKDKLTYFFISDMPIDIHMLDTVADSLRFAPLYLYQNNDNNNTELFDHESSRIPNFTEEFQKFISEKYSFIPSPEQIFGYIYAIFYGTSYRSRYEEFLKIDFPRVPFIDDEKKFIRLAELGSELIEHHLMKQSYSSSQVTFPIAGSDIIEEVRFVEEPTRPFGKVFINKQQYFDNIPINVWEFEIGGYRVLYSWLRYRKSMTLSYEWQEAFLKICNILAFTISQMKKIDEVLK